MPQLALALLLGLACAPAARADHRACDRGRSCARDCDRHGRGHAYGRYDRDRDRDRDCDWDRGRDRRWDRDRDDRDRCERDRCDRLDRGLAIARFVLDVVDDRHYRRYDCGCRHVWRSGYWDCGRDGRRRWVVGRYDVDRACRRHC